jgi:hypothetical protein
MHQLNENTYLNVEQAQGLKIDFEQLWQLEADSVQTCKSYSSRMYGER